MEDHITPKSTTRRLRHQPNISSRFNPITLLVVAAKVVGSSSTGTSTSSGGSRASGGVVAVAAGVAVVVVLVVEEDKVEEEIGAVCSGAFFMHLLSSHVSDRNSIDA